MTEEILTQYAAGPDGLDDALGGLSEPDLDIALEEGKWTIRQLVHHIVDADTLAKTMIMAALGNSGCRYDQRWYDTRNTFAETLDYANRSVAAAIAVFHANRHHLDQLLRHLPDALDRSVIVMWEKEPEGKELTVSYLVRGQTWHAEHHTEQIREIRRACGF
ncbi:MAG: DinB family protein [Gemmatimonadota bacterium]|nr:MAG: DinB family protein [Gemmatimonadota bacterium]